MTPNKTQPRVLIIAEAANPEWVSVPLVGWSLANALRSECSAHIVTQIRNRDAFLRAGLSEGQDFTAIDSEAFSRPMWKLGEALRMGQGKGWTTLQLINAISYPYFEHLIWKQFGDQIKRGDFDIMHRVTPLSPTISSSIAGKCAKAGVPFVLGPLNGGVPWPKGFDAERRREKEWLSYARSAYKALPGRKSTIKHASAILTGSKHTQSEIPAAFQSKCVYLPENGIDPDRFSGIASPQNGRLRAAFVGRMVPYKGPDMLLEAALPLLQSGAMSLDMIGDGPMLESLCSFALDHGIQDNVTFHGWVEHHDVQAILKTCNLFSFPSIREFGGGVVLEAMALGLPPLIVDYAGPGELVGPDWGIKVPIGPRAEIIAHFQTALTAIAADPAQLAPLGRAAKERIDSHFTWARKAAQVARVYDWVLGKTPKPDLFE